MSMPVLFLKNLQSQKPTRANISVGFPIYKSQCVTLLFKTYTMTNDELITKLKTIIAPYIQDEEAFKNLSENTDFVKDLKINSANLVDIILDIEDEFDIRLENEDMEKMLDVKSAMDIINSKLPA